MVGSEKLSLLATQIEYREPSCVRRRRRDRRVAEPLRRRARPGWSVDGSQSSACSAGRQRGHYPGRLPPRHPCPPRREPIGSAPTVPRPLFLVFVLIFGHKIRGTTSTSPAPGCIQRQAVAPGRPAINGGDRRRRGGLGGQRAEDLFYVVDVERSTPSSLTSTSPSRAA